MSAEPMTLTTINDDCKERIFEYLGCIDLMSVAESSKQLYGSACSAFYKKFGGTNGKIDFGLPFEDMYPEGNTSLNPQSLAHPNECVWDPVTALKIVRNFGHLITNLSLDYILFHTPTKESKYGCLSLIESYLAEYCSESLKQLALQNSSINHPIFDGIQKPITGIETLKIEQCTFDAELPFNTIFPNLQSLKLGCTRYRQTSAIRVHLPSLRRLWFYDKMYQIDDGFSLEDVAELFKLNPQIEGAVLQLHWQQGHYSDDFLIRILEYCKNIQIFYGARMQPNFNDSTYYKFVLQHCKVGRDRDEIYPAHVTDEYKNAMDNLLKLYATLLKSYA